MSTFGRGIEMPKGGDFFAKLPRSDARPTVINWPQQVKTIADQYKQSATVREGVQKDAIQNSWDARVSKSGDGWRIRFQLTTKNKPHWLSFTDYGTHGLTGRVLKPEELAADLHANERWGRFENLAFTKGPAEGSLGARGQGKFIFVAASEKMKILYDTLRKDGTYRFGVRWVETTDSPIIAFDGEHARQQIRAYSRDLQPLDSVGTRVIIHEPDALLVNSVVCGELARFIAVTWWEIISRYKATIEINAGDGKGFQRVTVPSDLILPPKDTDECIVSLKENVSFSLSGKKYCIEKLHLVSAKKGAVKDDIRGVALQRGGMCVQRLQIKHVPKEIAARV